jgi:dTDP-4-amino-4,6-dideoxy-D-galactose acyltransferase
MSVSVDDRETAPAERHFGSVTLRRLDWDTAHFGRKMGVLAIAPKPLDWPLTTLGDDLRRCLGQAADDGYAHVILRAGVEQLGIAALAEQCGLILVDVSVDLSAPVGVPGAQAPGLTIRGAAASDIATLREIAAEVFTLSRFSSDPFFSDEQTADFYRQWTTNLCSGLADVVLVAEVSGEIAGFTSCTRQPDGSGRIPLIATAATHRRQGIGRALVDASLSWLASAGIRTAYVKTQVANYPALGLYQSAGFTVAKGELTFSAMPKAAGR